VHPSIKAGTQKPVAGFGAAAGREVDPTFDDPRTLKWLVYRDPLVPQKLHVYDLPSDVPWASPDDLQGPRRAGEMVFLLPPRGTPRVRAYNPFTDEPGLFRKFAELDPDDSGQIARFASKYGLLGLYRPVRRPGSPGADPTIATGEALSDWKHHVRRMREVVWVWDRFQSREVNVLCDCVEISNNPDRTVTTTVFPGRSRVYNPEDDRDRYATQYFETVDRDPPTPRANRILGAVAGYLRHALTDGLGTMRASVDRGRDREFVLRHRPVNLCTALWLQLALTVAGSKRHRACKTCGRWFEISVEEDGRTARRQFCGDPCRTRQYRARKVEARKLAAEGKCVAAIARELGSDRATVEGWIEGVAKGNCG
jgi:hypothetical protein